MWEGCDRGAEGEQGGERGQAAGQGGGGDHAGEQGAAGVAEFPADLGGAHCLAEPAVASQCTLVSGWLAAGSCGPAVPVLPACAVPGSCFAGRCPAVPGLVQPPQAFWLSAPLAARDSRLRAALTSRSRNRTQ